MGGIVFLPLCSCQSSGLSGGGCRGDSWPRGRGAVGGEPRAQGPRLAGPRAQGPGLAGPRAQGPGLAGPRGCWVQKVESCV